MNENKDGSPTGKLNEDCTMMEVRCYLKDGLNPLALGTKWIPISDEVKAQIASQNVGVVSLGAVVTPEMLEDLQSDTLSPPGVTITPPPSHTIPSSLSEAGEESTAEEEEQWAAIRADMRAKSARVEEEVEKTEADEVPQRRSTDIKEPENTGFNVNYYSVHITHPKRPDRPPYIFEVDDLIGALNLTFNEGTVLKSLVRSANEREHGLAKLGNDAIRDAQKMVHSSGEHLRILQMRKLKAE